MSSFPRLPTNNVVSDDQASVHLLEQVGPARPMRRKNIDLVIRDVLRETEEIDSSDDEVTRARTHAKHDTPFQSFMMLNTDLDSDEDTQVEEEPPIVARKKSKQQVKKNSEPIASWRTSVLGFFVGLILVFYLPNSLSNWRPLPSELTSPDLSSIDARINSVENRLQALSDVSLALDQQVEQLVQKQSAHMMEMNENLLTLHSTINEYKNSQTLGLTQLAVLEEELAACKQRLDGLQLASDDPAELESRLSLISEKLSQLSLANAELKSIKDNIVSAFLKKLPSVVPVYIENNKIHYLPEFYKFVVSVMEDYQSAHPQNVTWDSFMKSNGKDFRAYIEDLQRKSNLEYVTKQKFESLLKKELSRSNEVVMANFNRLLDRIDLSKNLTSIDVSGAGNKIAIDNLLEIIGKGSLKVNYADYKLGARILGFLTTTGRDSYKERSLAGQLFLGWYDYITSHGLKSPRYMKFNANNILVDGGQYWQCESSWCAVGIRLSSPLILTDLVLKNPLAERPAGLEPPTSVSIFIRPRKKSQAVALETYLSAVSTSSQSSNRYLLRFYKIQEVSFRKGSSVEHIRLPVSIINMKIAVRDIYLELKTNHGDLTGLYNVRAYGLTELNAYSYGEQFESILSSLALSDLQSDFHDYDSQTSFVLGEDDYA